MQDEKIFTDSRTKTGEFVHRLDFYWQFIAIYSVALIIYAMLRGSIEEGTFSFTIKDPVTILLMIFILFSAFSLAINFYKKTSIIVGKDFLIFKSRFKEKKYSHQDIIRIAFGKERIINIKRAFRLIKIHVTGRRRIIRIRPSSYLDEKALLHALVTLKKTLNK